MSEAQVATTPTNPTWRCIAGSVAGPSHQRTGAPCQDSQRTQILQNGKADALVACVADGAGSASRSEEGSAAACEAIVEQATLWFDKHGSFADLTLEIASGWIQEARQRIERLADVRESTPREFATTLCVACVSPEGSAFFQIGDGVIVARRCGAFGVVFWPQSGEYANSTMFLTGEDFARHLEFRGVDGDFSDLALMTDGVERLALSFEARTPHEPFFQPLFRALRSASNPAALDAELVKFLCSDSVKSRSDDDKTVVLATNIASR